MQKLLLTLALVFFISVSLFSQTITKVKLLYPNGGEVFRAGTSVDIRWDTTGTLSARWNFQFATSPNGPWTDLQGATNILDSAARRGVYAGGFRVPAIKTTTGYLRIILRKSDGTVDPNVSDINDAPFTIEQPEPVKVDSVLKTPISTKVKLSASKIYGLDGYVYVDDGGELHIDAGTIIVGDTVGQNSAICVNRGGKIFAKGTKEKPIIMTSSATVGQRRGGDWGGLLICGKATTNHPGGEAALEGGIADQTTGRGFFGGKNNPDDNDNSGVIEYVRIEFAGIAAAPNQELNSLTLGAVGRGTRISHVMVSYANDDAYECFGGTVDAKNLIAVGTLDDDLDCDNGFSGRIQYALIQRFKDRADVSTAQAWEIDNDASGSYNLPLTRVLFSNVTAIGPLQDTSWTPSSTGAGATNYHTRFGACAQIRRNARASIFNSVIIGWPRGIEILSTPGQLAASRDSLMIRNNSFFGIKGELLRRDGKNPAIPPDWLLNPDYSNFVDVSNPKNANITDPFVVGLGFNPVPKSTANYLNNARFDNGSNVVNIADSYFDKVSYRGAFSDKIAERWDLPWAEYDPINKNYQVTSVENGHQWILDVQINPNPASEYANVLYQIPNNDIVTIRIFDATGRQLDTVVNNLQQNQGFYQFAISTNNLPAGIYYIQIQTSKGSIIKNLNVVR